jgi:hypothetical protein
MTKTGSGTSTTVSGLNPATTYTFVVTNASGCTSPASANVVINSLPAMPTPPAISSVTQPTAKTSTGSVTLTGLPASGNWTLIRYQVGLTAKVTTTGKGTTKTITGIAPGTYYFTVTNSSGCTSVSSSEFTIYAYGSLALKAGSLIENAPSDLISLPENGDGMVNVYPNPVRSELTIDYILGTYKTVSVLNANGMEIMKEKVTLPSQQIDFSRYTRGLYFIKLTGTDGLSRIVKVIHQ